MLNQRGFTIIELIIVVAIIGIVAMIAVPNIECGGGRSKVSRVRSDMRSLATAIESYYVDHNTYPAMAMDPALTVDGEAYGPKWEHGQGRTFRSAAGGLETLTTPVAYVTNYFPDPFADARNSTFRYFCDGDGWILGSWGPDVDQARGGDLMWDRGSLALAADAEARRAMTVEQQGIEAVYDSSIPQPSELLLAGASSNGAFTYDPTNGTESHGDLWRVKQ
jgi:prepilin-type N-terminal cleavage/methylation domain-containing protein